jgi:hypothetical protein
MWGKGDLRHLAMNALEWAVLGGFALAAHVVESGGPGADSACAPPPLQGS